MKTLTITLMIVFASAQIALAQTGPKAKNKKSGDVQKTELSIKTVEQQKTARTNKNKTVKYKPTKFNTTMVVMGDANKTTGPAYKNRKK
jgi:hypothetical protein